MGKVSIVGAGMRSHPGVAAKVFSVLAEEGVNIEMISTSPIKISCVIEREHVEQAVQVLHGAFELSGARNGGRGASFRGASGAVAPLIAAEPRSTAHRDRPAEKARVLRKCCADV